MKKTTCLLLLLCTLTAQAKVEFAYDASAEVTSAYLWRGQYLGGLSVQPNLGVGYEGEITSLMVSAWGNIGASDYHWASPDCYFAPELDLSLAFSVYGINLGFTHYYYFGGSNFLCWKPLKELVDNEWSSTTEAMIGLDLSYWVEILPIYVNWYTTVAGYDPITAEDDTYKRAYSSYLELGCSFEWEKPGLSLDANIGFAPWACDLYGNSGFAIQCISARLDKTWEWEHWSLGIFAQGMINPFGINKENAYINIAGEEKLGQTLNGCLGVNFAF